MADQKSGSPKPEPMPVEPVPVGPRPVEPEPVEPEPLAVEPEPVAASPGQAGEDKDQEEPISLVDGGETEGPSRIHAMGRGSALETGQYEFKRPMNVTGTGATRCRLFHSRIATAPLEYMQRSINEWLDAEGIEVKQVGHIIGTMEGKTPEPNLLVMIWY